jgi:hypothetical protein
MMKLNSVFLCNNSTKINNKIGNEDLNVGAKLGL